MRVLAMAHAYPPHHNAGAEMTMRAMLRRLVEHGHEVHVQLSRQVDGPSVDYELDGVQVHAYRDAGSVMPFFLARDHKADVVIAHLENTPRAAALAQMHGIPMVHLLHNNHEFSKGCVRRGPTQLAIFNTEWMRADFEAYWRTVSHTRMPPSIVIHPPVVPMDYQAKHGQAVTLINLNEDKGGHHFWRLAYRMPQVKFLAVKGAYGEQIVPPGLSPNVWVLDHQPPEKMATEVYGKTKILLMPSSYESYGRTAIEAAYAGIPTIAHPTPGLKEALGGAGTFVDRDDLDGWAAAIKYLLSPRGFNQASARARAHAESLDPQGDLDRFVDAMEGVVRRGFAAIAG